MIKKLIALVLLAFFCVQLGTSQSLTKRKKQKKSKASWYGAFFQGKRTASGQVFDMKKLTAAHKTLPFGTKLKVINVKNGKSVVVTINDRGPGPKSRILDLSKAAFQRIAGNRSGIIQVFYERL